MSINHRSQKKLYNITYLSSSECGIQENVWANTEEDVRKRFSHSEVIFSIEEKNELDHFTNCIDTIQSALKNLQHELDVYFDRA